MGRLVSLIVDKRSKLGIVGEGRIGNVVFYFGGMVLKGVGNVYCPHEQFRRMGAVGSI